MWRFIPDPIRNPYAPSVGTSVLGNTAMNAEDFTLVTWELAELPGGACRVTLTHSRWNESMKSYKSVGTTWGTILRLLELELETGAIDGKTRFMYGMFSALEFVLPKTTSVASVEQRGW